MAGRRVKRIEIWASGMNIQFTGYLLRLMLQGILVVIRCISHFQNLCAPKTAGLRE